jgi:sulfonate transport system substrate-binding protein
LLEALNAGAIDIGSTGDTPPIFAQAADAPLVYVAYTSSSGAGSGIIVQENSPIQTVEDLRGKTVAFTQASSAHLLLIRTLEANGLSYADVNPVFLAPADARAAFESGSVDAWVIWNPFYTAAVQEINARVLVSGENISRTNGYVEASRAFVDEHPELVLGIIEELQVTREWVLENVEEYANLQAEDTGLNPSVWIEALEQEPLSPYYFIDDESIAYQQGVADLFFNIGLIPEPLDIASVVWIGGVNPEPEATAEATLEVPAESTTTP